MHFGGAAILQLGLELKIGYFWGGGGSFKSVGL